MTEDALSVVIADDSVLLRDGLVRLVEDAGIEVLAAVGDAVELMEAMRIHQPDLVAVLVLSQYVEERYASELLAGDAGGVGYLLKDRVVDIGDFVSSLHRLAAGGSAVDAEVVRQVLSRSRRKTELERLTPRERDVLEAMAEGLSNSGIAEKLVISGGAVEKHIGNVFQKLDLELAGAAHRRVLAVLAYLGSESNPHADP